jgi:hypothetical protein
MIVKHIWTPKSANMRPEHLFPFIKFFNGKSYHQSLINPNYVRNCTKIRADQIVSQLRREGWRARAVKYETPIGFIHVVYERRSEKQLHKMAKDYGIGHVRAARIVNKTPREVRSTRRRRR